ncbi:MAG: hypothetical protein R2825_09155 [Saprospiraceae bacterium]
MDHLFLDKNTVGNKCQYGGRLFSGGLGNGNGFPVPVFLPLRSIILMRCEQAE